MCEVVVEAEVMFVADVELEAVDDDISVVRSSLTRRRFCTCSVASVVFGVVELFFFFLDFFFFFLLF
jgi:hypothetical protein